MYIESPEQVISVHIHVNVDLVMLRDPCIHNIVKKEF